MAYLSLIRLPGNAEELAVGPYRQTSEVMERVSREHGIIAHVAAKTDEGLLIVNLWESQEGSEATARDPEVQRAQQATGIPREQVRFEHYDVANYEIIGS